MEWRHPPPATRHNHILANIVAEAVRDRDSNPLIEVANLLATSSTGASSFLVSLFSSQSSFLFLLLSVLVEHITQEIYIYIYIYMCVCVCVCVCVCMILCVCSTVFRNHLWWARSQYQCLLSSHSSKYDSVIIRGPRYQFFWVGCLLLLHHFKIGSMFSFKSTLSVWCLPCVRDVVHFS